MQWAILLIDQYGIRNVNHEYILKCKVAGSTWLWSWPGLDPNSIICVHNRAVFHLQSNNILLIVILPQAPHAVKKLKWNRRSINISHRKSKSKHACVLYLIPCPGPQVILDMKRLVVPGPMEMQSSPVPMTELVMLTWAEFPMWMPSVLGLSSGDEMLMPEM